MKIPTSPALWFLCLPLTGCLGTLPFDEAVTIRSIHDHPGPEDVVLADFARVEGFAEGLYALTLPEDWKDRPAALRAGGFPALVPPIVQEWTMLKPELRTVDRPLTAPSTRVPWQFIRGELTLEEASAVARERLAAGQDTYWLGAIEERGDPALWSCELLGARPANSQPSSASKGLQIEWVLLARLEFQDARSNQSRKLRRTRNELGAGAAMLVVYGGSLAVWVLLLG